MKKRGTKQKLNKKINWCVVYIDEDLYYFTLRKKREKPVFVLFLNYSFFLNSNYVKEHTDFKITYGQKNSKTLLSLLIIISFFFQVI